MGLRFRKSIKLGKGARINFSKSGVGASIGTKGLRYTLKAGGGSRTTASIPGTGISYTKDSRGGSKPKKSSNTHSAKYDLPEGQSGGGSSTEQPVTLTEIMLAWLLGFFGAHKFYRNKTSLGVLYLFTAGLFFVGWIGDAINLTARYSAQKNGKDIKNTQKYGSYVIPALVILLLGSCGGNTPEESPLPTVPETMAIITETTQEQTEAPSALTAAETTMAPPTIAETEATEPTPEEKAIETAVEETKIIETTIPEIEENKATEPTEEMVWIPTNGGGKYHSRPSCSGMKNPKEVPISQATARGLTPCKRCH